MESTVQNSVRYVVSSRHPGAVIPGKREEMWRDIYVEDGAEIEGGVFGNNTIIEGTGVRIDGAVHVRGGVTVTAKPGVTSEKEKTITFNSVVSAKESLLIEEHVSSRTRFLADIFSDQVNMSNAFICGNVYAKRAILKNCVVLGGVFCSEKLTLENVVLSTFRASKVDLKKELMLFYPFALAEEPIRLDFSAKSLSFANLMMLAKGNDQICNNVVFMNQEDVVKINEIENEEEKQFHMLSLGSRILDMEDLKNAFETNAKFLKMLSLGDHLKPSDKHQFQQNDLANMERILFEMLEKPPEDEVINKVPIEDMAKRESVTEFLEAVTNGAF